MSDRFAEVRLPEVSEADRRETLRGLLLDTIANYGGKRIEAGPEMARLVRDLVDCVDAADRAGLTLGRRRPLALGQVFRRGDVQALCLGVRGGRALLAEIVDGVADGAFHDPQIGDTQLEHGWEPSWMGEPGTCRPHAGVHVTPHRGCILR